MIRLCLVRHGETDWNIAQRMQGHRDQPLNSRGMAQAEALGRYFSGHEVTRLFSSDLQRARQTAQTISSATGQPVRLLPALRERHFGRCEGLTFEEIATHHEADALALKARAADYAAAGGETLRQHQLRVLAGVDRLLGEKPEGPIVVVTHGGVLDVLYRRAKGMPLGAPRDFPIPNAGISWLQISGGYWEIVSWGETGHLEEAPETVRFPV